MTAPAERWVVRRSCGADGGVVQYFYWGAGNYPCWSDSQSGAGIFIDRVDALNVAGNTGGKAVRLVSRAEAVASAAKRARVEALREAAGIVRDLVLQCDRYRPAAEATLHQRMLGALDRLAKESSR